MENVEFQVVSTAGKIDCNLKEIKEALAVQMTAYTSLEVTEGDIKERKADLATLRKIRKAVDDERKRVKEEFVKPYETFESEVKEVLALIDEPIGMIDSKLKAFDKKRIEEKQAHLHELYEENIGEMAEYIPYEMAAKKQWSNASYKDSDILYDISEIKTRVRSALDAVHALGSEIEDELIKVLQDNNFDLTKAIQRNAQYLADKEKIQAMANPEPEPESAEVKETESTAPVDQLHDLVDNLQTVKLIISRADLEEAENILGLSGISYRILED